MTRTMPRWLKAPVRRAWRRCGSAVNGPKAGRGGLVRCGGNIEPRVLVDIIPCGMVGLLIRQ